jgi:arginine:pyruvate transaminase
MAGYIAKLALCMLYGLHGFIQQGAIEALENSADALTKGRDIYRHRRDLALAHLGTVEKLSCLSPEAGMFLMIDVRGTGLSSADFANQLYHETGVSLLDATAFGPSAQGHVRLSFAVSDAQIAEGCRRIKKFIECL